VYQTVIVSRTAGVVKAYPLFTIAFQGAVSASSEQRGLMSLQAETKGSVFSSSTLASCRPWRATPFA